MEVRPVHLSCGQFAPYAWESRQPWYQAPHTATFLVLGLTGAAGAEGTAAQATAQFGTPERAIRIGDYEVMIWNHDLLPALTGLPSGCGPPPRDRWARYPGSAPRGPLLAIK